MYFNLFVVCQLASHSLIHAHCMILLSLIRVLLLENGNYVPSHECSCSVHLVELIGTGQLFAMKAMDKSMMLNRNKVCWTSPHLSGHRSWTC